jgi:hypothetical protein
MLNKAGASDRAGTYPPKPGAVITATIPGRRGHRGAPSELAGQKMRMRRPAGKASQLKQSNLVGGERVMLPIPGSSSPEHAE